MAPLQSFIILGIIIFIGVGLLVGVRFLTGHLQDNPWRAVIGDISAVVLVSVLLAPVVTDHFAREREREQRVWAARTVHLERLRPILLEDAKNLAQIAKSISDLGHVIPIFSKQREKDYDDTWFRHILIRDFGAHFSEFFHKRETLRTEVTTHESEVMDKINRSAKQVKVDKTVNNEEHRVQVAYALLHRCIGKGVGMKLEVGQDSFNYLFSTGGSGGGSGPGARPSEVIVAQFRAFEEYKPDTTFQSDCKKFAGRLDSIVARITELATDARSLAELAALSGDCPYTRVD